jgi:hypothetical protein
MDIAPDRKSAVVTGQEVLIAQEAIAYAFMHKLQTPPDASLGDTAVQAEIANDNTWDLDILSLHVAAARGVKRNEFSIRVHDLPGLYEGLDHLENEASLRVAWRGLIKSRPAKWVQARRKYVQLSGLKSQLAEALEINQSA